MGFPGIITKLLQRHPVLWQSGVLILMGLITFWPSLQFDFVNWDDPAYIQHNDLIKSWSFSNLKGVATEVVTRNYAPITIFSFLIEYTLWGMNPTGYHATNVLLHVANAILVFLLLRRVTGSGFVGWLTAALFLIHPVQIESVVWISSRKGLLCSLFMLASLWVRMKPQPTPRDDAYYFIFLALALFSKAHAIVLPPLVLLYDLQIRRQPLSQSIPRHIIPAFMALWLLLLTMGAQNTVLGGVRGHMNLGLLQILAVDVTILWQYIGMLCCPTRLCVMYDPPTSEIGRQVIVGSFGWAFVAMGLWRVRKSHPLWILGAFSFLLLLFPMLNFFRITTLMNDRYLYLPSIIVFAMAASIIERAFRGTAGELAYVLNVIKASVKGCLAAVALAACFVITHQHLPVWTNPESLWTQALSQYPDMPILRIQYALTVYSSGRVDEALRLMKSALKECQPDEQDRERMRGFVSDWTRELNQTQAVAERSTLQDSK